MTRWTCALVCLASSAANAQAPAPTRAAAPTRATTPKVTPAAGYDGLGADSVSPAEVARYAAAPLARAVSRRIEAMLDVRGTGAGLITSRGARMYFTSALTGVNQVWRQDGAMGFPVQLTGGEDRTSAVGIAPDDSFVVVARDVGGQENPGLYLLDPRGGALRTIVHTPKVQAALQFISDDSKSLYFRANDRDPGAYALYRYDLATGRTELVFDAPGLWSIDDHRGGTWLLTKDLGNTQVEVYEYDVARKQLTPVIGQGEAEDHDVRYGARPGQILVRTNKRGDFQRLYSLERGVLTPITPEVTHDVVAFAIDSTRRRIYLQHNERGYQQVTALDARTLRPLALPALPAAESVSLAGLSHNGRYLQLQVEGSTLPPTSYTHDWQTRRRVAWRTPMAPEIDVGAFATATLESYPARDGAQIPMFVRRPKACTAPCPVIVDFHGGPESQTRPGFAPRAQLFVDAGFVYVQPNVRGSNGYGKAWLHADDGPKRLAVITDIEDIARFIRATWGAGGKAPKIGVTGSSYGGYSVLMAMTYFAGAFDAGVQVVGIASLTTFLANTAPYRRILRTSEYGDPVTDKAALIELSPVTHVARIKAPLLSIQGVNDPRVPVGEALQITRELARRAIPGGLILFPDEGHGVSRRENQVLAIGHTIAFFEKHLLGR